MENTVIEGQENVTENVESQGRTFTQEEVDTIVMNRLKRESAKYANYEELSQKASKFDEMEEASKSELQKANEKAEALQKKLDAITRETEVRNIREKVAKETGVPADLLHGDNEEDCLTQAQGILAYKNEQTAIKYPQVKDGGEVQGLQKGSAESQFAEWFNQQI